MIILGLSFVSFDSSNQIKYMPMVCCVSAGVFLRDLCGLLGFLCSQNTHSPAMMVTSLASLFNEEYLIMATYFFKSIAIY